MSEIFQVLDTNRSKDVCFMTLTDCNYNSENRYYVSLVGNAARVDWKRGDRIMVDMSLCAYKNKGIWHGCHPSNTLKLIEIGNIDYGKKTESGQ